MRFNLADIRYLLEVSGKREYGQEAVSQLKHALQCASLAQEAKETPQTIIAALLRDLGHLFETEQVSDIVETEARDDVLLDIVCVLRDAHSRQHFVTAMAQSGVCLSTA